jgi:beta-galactosidase
MKQMDSGNDRMNEGWKGNSIIVIFVLLTGLMCNLQLAVAQESKRLNTNWEFIRQDLGGIWEAVRPVGKGNPESVPIWQQVTLPHCVNAIDAVDPDVNYYQGASWYRNDITIENPYQEGRTLLHFEGAGQKAEVYVYTTKVGSHVGGYDEWTVDITEAVAAFKKTEVYQKQFKGKIPVSIRTDNSRDLEMIPSDLSDFNVYGGIYRYLNLVYIPSLSVEKLFAKAETDASGTSGQLSVHARFYNPDGLKQGKLLLKLIDPSGKLLKKTALSLSDFAGDQQCWNTTVPKPRLWSDDIPQLYTVEYELKSTGGTYKGKEKIGFRNFEFVEKGPFKLNGKRLLLRGTHRHEDHAGVAAAMTEDMIRQEMLLMKEMGVNFIRLAHYQQSRIVLNLCDSLGIMVWEEIPWCRGGLGGDSYKEQARRMLTNMIEQHYNHTSVIIWGLGNENDWPGDFPEFDKEKIRAFMKELNALSHQLDRSRLTAIRRCDFCSDIVDVYSPSIWAGWYRGNYTDYKQVSVDEFKKVKRFLHVEWGGDSHAMRHSENPDNALSKIKPGSGADERAGDASLFGGSARISKDGDWSESYLTNLVDWHLKEQEQMPWLTGTAYWPFKDFSTPVRPDNPVPYMNQKGVVERDMAKKESYYVFQSYWTEKPMLHIYGHTWPVRSGNEGEQKMVKVYSNCTAAELFLNGKSFGMKKRNSQDFPAAGLHWSLPFVPGENVVSVVGKKGKAVVKDEIKFRYQTEKWSTPAKMVLTKIGQQDDVATLEVKVYDNRQVQCLDAVNLLSFSLAGDGKLIDNMGTSSGSKKVQAYNGRAIIRVQLNKGKSMVAVSSEGLPVSFVEL